MIHAGVLFLALAVDAALGWPRAVHARIGHPVTWMGWLIERLDRHLNRESDGPLVRRALGLLASLLVIGLSAGLAALAQGALPQGWPGLALAALLAWPFLAMRSLHDHVAAVARPLAAGDPEAARAAVAMIVGRDPARLDEAGVARAALESLAENTSDGITAPLFWGLLFGLPGLAGYKAVNTLDSMIGHRTPRHEDFGKPAARIDDLANLIPARLTGVLFALVSGHARAALSTMRRDARRHRSPNAGWPEAALAGAIGVRLSGPRRYHGRVALEPWLNGAAPDPVPEDLARGLRIYRHAMLALGAALLVLALA